MLPQDILRGSYPYINVNMKKSLLAQLCFLTEETFDKLFAYEKAAWEGRLLMLPCKVGATIYAPRKDTVLEHTVTGISLYEDDCLVHVSFSCDHKCDGCPHEGKEVGADDAGCQGEMGDSVFHVEEIGKTVFLTQKEAEAHIPVPDNKQETGMTANQAIEAFKTCMTLMCFDPMTGEECSVEDLNELNRDLYFACEMGIKALREKNPE